MTRFSLAPDRRPPFCLVPENDNDPAAALLRLPICWERLPKKMSARGEWVAMALNSG